ncbi:MAG: quinone oxidoreductase YhdH/YhfP family [Gallionellaceae bacterium]|nr:MAG: quinone oxidoreductase YhdH/YhfP family [Gallionellaceae bacterium]
MDTFHAYRIFNEGKTVSGRFVEMNLNELDSGEVVIRTAYSSVNFKDALAATGAGKIIRRFPCVGGVDAAGVVESSQDARFQPGDEVVITGYEMGVAHDGGYAEYVRVPAAWVVRLPPGLTMFEAMALGTAGFTAALAIHRLEQNDLKPENGRVLVTGATGGVGSLAIQMLAQLGYRVVALTGKDSEHEYLKSLGANEILPRSAIDASSNRALERAQWAGALDAVGGETLSWLVRSMLQNGAIASFGNTGGAELHISVYPFILRGVRLLGVDSAATLMPLREKIWKRLAGELRPKMLGSVARTVAFSENRLKRRSNIHLDGAGQAALGLPIPASFCACWKRWETVCGLRVAG